MLAKKSKSTPVKSLRPRKKKLKGEAKSGALYVIAIMGVVITFGGVMAGGLLPKVDLLKGPPPPGVSYTCCDSGDGAACQPNQQRQVVYNGQTYALLKSNIVQPETQHMDLTTQFTPENNRIFINTSDTFDAEKEHGSILPGSNCEKGKDYIRLNDPSIPDTEPYFGGYFCIPNDELIYVCKDTAANCNTDVRSNATPFDVYYRISDGPVPVEISTKCPKPVDASSGTGQQVIGIPTPGGRKNLQLETFQIQEKNEPYPWLSAWCKPAVYLYPEQKTSVSVQVAPQGKLLLTIPEYPKEGWNVIADTDGSITYKDKTYPYLYWEASLPDAIITQPKEGYVVTHDELAGLFAKVLPQTGLNQKEIKEFSEYWLKALPESPYYFVGLVPQKQIDSLAPLTIKPSPDSVLRVSLYFQALDKKIAVKEPTLIGFTRKGFTVTEWGGLFKADKNHPDFTCAM